VALLWLLSDVNFLTGNVVVILKSAMGRQCRTMIEVLDPRAASGTQTGQIAALVLSALL
jgi:hypothetical protein